jgi:hypothetical protein
MKYGFGGEGGETLCLGATPPLPFLPINDVYLLIPFRTDVQKISIVYRKLKNLFLIVRGERIACGTLSLSVQEG